MTYDTKTVWQDALESTRVSVSSAIYKTWFSQTHLVSLADNQKRVSAEIGCATAYVKEYLEKRYFGLIQDTLTKILEKSCDLIFLVKELPLENKKEFSPAPLFATPEDNSAEFAEAVAKARITNRFTFENFAVSSSNQMAYAAAEAVAKTPGKAYNPLFIWGGVGVGKSHLMHAVGQSVLKVNPALKVLACTAEDFTNDIVEGIRNKTTPEVRNKYRKLNVLLIDDIQFIAGKDTAQEEFFHTFNTVTSAGGQIILTSDQPPSEISKLEERLISRFEAGLIVDISPPDFELRCAITQIRAKEKGLNLEMKIIQLIAANLDSARKIEGFLTKLLVKNIPLSPESVEALLTKGQKENNQALKAKPEEIINAVAKYFSLGKRILLGECRQRPIARPRQILMYLLRTELEIPLKEVGRLIGGRDHTTVMHGVEKITHLASTDVQIREDILGIKNSL
jgi:chromosomal replication initiator protein